MKNKKKSQKYLINDKSSIEDVKRFLKIKLHISEKSIDSMGLDGNDLLTLNENEINNLQCLTLEERDKLINFVKIKI